MRKLLLVAVLSVLSLPCALAQRGGGRGGRGGGPGGPPAPPPGPPPVGLECFDNLAMPEFPRAALQQKVDGTVWVHEEVGSGGAPGKIDVQVTSAWADGAKLLQPPVEAVIHAAKLKPECADKTVLAVFRYELHGGPVANPQVTTRKEPSYIVWIESQPMAAPASAKK